MLMQDQGIGANTVGGTTGESGSTGPTAPSLSISTQHVCLLVFHSRMNCALFLA